MGRTMTFFYPLCLVRKQGFVKDLVEARLGSSSSKNSLWAVFVVYV